MESHMPQDVLLAEYHGTFHDTLTLFNLQNQLDEKRGDKEDEVIDLCLHINWRHIFEANMP
jgi:hypothetical protein